MNQRIDNQWDRNVLRAAGIYNIAWGAFAILFPSTFFRWVGVDPLPLYPEFWQCIGMIVGVYGVGYWIAGSNPLCHWPIVLVGLLGKVFGPIGFLQAVLNDRLPPLMGLTILTNDIIWWIPFALILWHARLHHLAQSDPAGLDDPTYVMKVSSSVRSPRTTIVWSSLHSRSEVHKVS